MFFSSKTKPLDFLILFLFTAASVFSINQYRYGLDDHAIILPFLKRLLDPSLYPHDIIFEQMTHYYSFLWKAFQVFLFFFPVGLATVFFMTYSSCLFLTFLAAYLIALSLFEKKEVAWLSLFFLLCSQRAMAGIGILEIMLIPRMAALPFLLFALYFFLKKSYLLSFFFQGLGFLIHPQMAIVSLAMTLTTFVFQFRAIGVRKIFSSLLLFGFLAGPMLLWRWDEAPHSLNLFSASPDWLKLLALRVPHHVFPSLWDGRDFVRAGWFLLFFGISLKSSPPSERHQTVLSWMGTVLLLCFFQFFFVEILPAPLVFNLRPFRSFLFLMIFTFPSFANYFVNAILSPSSFVRKSILILIAMGVFYHARLFWPVFYGAFAAWGLGVAFSSLNLRRASPGLLLLSLMGLTIGLSAGGHLARLAGGRGGFSIQNAASPAWLEVQQWAKRNTDPADVFIVPPTSMGFRVVSERSIYGDWKDGQLLARDPGFGEEWLRRMKRLGYEENLKGFRDERFRRNFLNLKEEDFLHIAEEIKPSGPRVHLVMPQDARPFAFPLLYQNSQFEVYEVRA